ncbi:MAG: hypothetical protein QG623_519 [Patescibacteria group bacterium]|nr:hypothetical protein [Patescibacteria group bacterium]
MRAKLKPETLLVDVCSVKVIPANLINEYLPNHKNLLLSHPLFGPQSAKESTTNLKFIVTGSVGGRAKELVYFCQNKLKLSIIYMTAEDHDRAMAYTHALTFFVSQSLHPFKLEEHGITTPSFNELLDLSNIAKNESKELLISIHKSNPYSKEVRDKFADQVTRLKEELDK